MLMTCVCAASMVGFSTPEWTRAVERHQQSLQQLASYQFEYTVKGKFGNQQFDQKGTYTYSNGRYHFNTRDSASRESKNVFVSDGRCLSFETFKNGHKQVVIARSTGNISTQNNIPYNLCFSFQNLIHPSNEKSDLMTYAKDMESHFLGFEPEIVGGLNCLRATFRRPVKIPGQVDRIWLAPDKNWLVAKCGSFGETETQKYYGVYYREVLEWAEPRKGIFFPQKVVFRANAPIFDVNDPSPPRDVYLIDFTTTISQIRINPPIQDSFFSPLLAVNTFVFDEIEQCHYTVGPNGQKLNYESQISKTPLSGTEPKATPTVVSRPPTVDEPTPWSRWLLPASIVLLIGAAIFKWRHSRANRDGS
jgi:outer membrane lipoprotein-sorting protein